MGAKTLTRGTTGWTGRVFDFRRFSACVRGRSRNTWGIRRVNHPPSPNRGRRKTPAQDAARNLIRSSSQPRAEILVNNMAPGASGALGRGRPRMPKRDAILPRPVPPDGAAPDGGNLVDYVRTMFGLCSDYVRTMFAQRPFQDYVRTMFGPCSDHGCTLPGP